MSNIITGLRGPAPSIPAMRDAADEIERLRQALAISDTNLRILVHERARADRLQRIIDSRPAINAGLPQTYINWSQSIYAMEMAHATETAQ